MRTIPDPGFAGDDGSVPVALADALEVYREDPDGGYLPALAALGTARLLVPVVALLDEVETDPATGLAREKSSDMAAVLMQHPDGRRALLAFTGADSLATWNPEARPVPVAAATAAAAAIQEDAKALLIDVDGPARLVVQGEDLVALAQGWRLVRIPDGEGAGGWGWLTPEVPAEVPPAHG